MTAAPPGEPEEGVPPTRRPPERIDGYAPIEEYAVLGDGRTAALVASDGAVDWWPMPTLDAPPVCAAILDPARGGHLLLAPADTFTAARRYLPDTNVVEVAYTTTSGRARVTAALNSGGAGRLPWTELAFRIEGLEGEVPMRWELAPGDRFGMAEPWATSRRGVALVTVLDQTLAVVTSGAGPVDIEPHTVSGALSTAAGSRHLLAVVATDGEPVFLPQPAAIDARIDRTIRSWRRWIEPIRDAGEWTAAVRRSALALKCLITEASGAIAAAATTSLPEDIGRAKNWDYRFSWVRDSSFTVDALIRLGADEEAHGAVSWLLDAIRRNSLQIFYTLDGNCAEHEATLDAPGYRGSRPVRAGNSASAQSQLGVYGDLFATVHRYCQEGHVLDVRTGQLLAGLADSCCDQWRRPDSGIWELDDPHHYTISKMGCWVALDRAERLAGSGQVPDYNRGRWAHTAAEIRDWVNQHCWSERHNSYSFYAGTDDIDAATLLAGRTGFDRRDRLAGTIDAVVDQLGSGPLIYRYSGVDAEEGAFVACSFWLVEALVHTGQIDRASDLMGEMLQTASDVGLYSEQIDPGTGAFLGNTPQGLSHLALINAAYTLHDATKDQRSPNADHRPRNLSPAASTPR